MVPMETLDSFINSEYNLKENADKTIGVFFTIEYTLPNGIIYYRIDEDLSVTGKVDWLRKVISDKVLIPEVLPVTGWGGDDPNEAYANLGGYFEESKDRIWVSLIYKVGDKYNTPEYLEKFRNDPVHYKTILEINEMKAKFLIDYDYQIHVMKSAVAIQERTIALLEGNQ